MYIYLCRKVSRSARDQCKVIVMPIINCIHFCLRSNIGIFKMWGFCSTSKFIQLIGQNKRILEIYLNKCYIGVTTEIKLLRTSNTLNHVQVVNVSR